MSVAVAAALMADPAFAASAPTTAGDLAACATAADQPICLLKIASHFRRLPYRYDIRLAYAQDVLGALEDDVGREQGLGFGARIQLGLDGTMVDRQGLACALEADRRGASPAAALTLLMVPDDRPGMQAKTPVIQQAFQAMVETGRAGADEAIFKAFKGPDALPPRGQPSLALVKLALADWEKLADEWSRSGRDMYRTRLAAAYLALGDKAAAARVDSGIKSVAGVREGWIALHAGDLDRATTWAVKATPSNAPDAFDDYSDIKALREAVVAAADAAGRRELSARAAAAQLALALAPKPESKLAALTLIEADAPLAVIVRDASRDDLLSWSSRLDAAARDLSSPQSAKNAVAAARGWTAAGEPEKARTLALLWAPEHVIIMGKCDEVAAPGCVQRGLNRLRVATDVSVLLARVLSPSDQVGQGLSPTTGLSEDIMDGRGAGRLDDYLTLSPPAGRGDLLYHCVWLAADKGELAPAHACLKPLITTLPSRAYFASHPALAAGDLPASLAGNVIILAAVAAKENPKLMHVVLDLALELLSRTPGVTLNLIHPEKLEDIAIAELREQGRL